MKKPILIVSMFLIGGFAWGQKKNKTPITCDSTVLIPPSLIIDNNVQQVFLPDFTYRKPVEYRLQVFDLIGLLVFETDDYRVGWNGRFKYSVVQHGNYRWEITYRYESENEKRYCWGKVIMNTQKN